MPDPRPDPDHVERQQLQRAQRGDNRAFADLIQRHDPMLRTVVAHLVGPEATDEQLTATYVKAYRGLPVYRSEHPPRLWLCQLAVASCLDQLRRRQRRLRLPRRGPVGSVAPPPPPTVPPPAVDNGRAPSPESGIRILDEAPDVDETTGVHAVPDDDDASREHDEASEEGTDAGDDQDVDDDQRDTAATGADVDDQQSAGDLGSLLVAQALQSLLVEDRVAVVLVDGAGIESKDAAAVVEVTPATLQTRLSRGRGQLRKQLGSPPEAQLRSRATRRDGRDIAQWLDRLPVPEHDEEFWQVLGEELLEASDLPAAPGPDPGRTGRLPVWLGPAARVPSPSTIGTGPGADDRNVRGLAYRARQVAGGRRSTAGLGRWLAGAAVVVLLLAVLGAGFLLAGRASRKDASLGLTSVKVVSKVDDALAADQSIAGTLTVDSGGPPVHAGTYQFVRAADGSYRITSSTGWQEAYDASTGNFTVSGSPANGAPVSLQAAHLAPGLPDPTAAFDAALGDPLGSVMRLFAVGQNKALTQLGSNGAPQYVLDADLPPVGSGPYESTDAGSVPGTGSFARSGGADHIRILIDESLQLPTDVQLTRQQNSVMHLRFTNVSVDQAQLPGTFDISTGGPVIDPGFKAIQLGQAPAAVGYQPLTPSYLPGGFVLTAVTARFVSAGAPSTAGGRNPPDVSVLVITYRHGADAITVTTRRYTSQPGKVWLDPFVTTGSAADRPVAITAGYFLNAPANVGNQPVPHVWGHDRQYVFTVAGDAPTSELVRVASSLH